MSALNISTFVNGLTTAYFAIFAYLLLTGKERTRLRTMIGYIFVYWTFANLKDIMLSQPGIHTDEVLNTIIIIDGWSAITFACLLFELTMPGWVTLWRVLLMCIPFALFSAAYAAWPSKSVQTAYISFLVAFGVSIISIGYAKMRKYTLYVHENYSNIDEIDISWIKQIYVIGFFSQLAWLVTSMMRSPALDALYYISSIALWHITLHYCRRLKPVRPEAEHLPAFACNAGTTKDYPFAGTLEQTVEQERLYLNPNLSLSNLANRLGTNRTYLSDYFSKVKGVTFYDYINSLRVERKSAPLMADHPEYTLDYIAAQSGFNSLSTFRRAFRKHMGMNPGSYRG